MKHARVAWLISGIIAILSAALTFTCSDFTPSSDPASDSGIDARSSATTDGGDGGSEGGPPGSDGGGADSSVPVVDKRVFVTGVPLVAADLALADKKCSDVARQKKGNWVGWVSTAGTLAKTRIAEGKHFFRYGDDASVGTTAQVLAGTLENAILYDESGAAVPSDAHVWTGTFADGGLGANCLDWTFNGGGQEGVIGIAGRTTPSFTGEDLDNCGSLNRLYCFEK